MTSRGKRAFATLMIVSLLTLIGSLRPSGGARAQAGGEPLSTSDFAVFQPIAGYLSNASWLLVTGQDPRLLDVSSGMAPGIANGFTLSPLSRSPGPVFSRNLLVSHNVGPLGLTSEPRLVADPFDPEHLVLAVVDYNLPSIATYVTRNGGETWDGPQQVRFLPRTFSLAGHQTWHLIARAICSSRRSPSGWKMSRWARLSRPSPPHILSCLSQMTVALAGATPRLSLVPQSRVHRSRTLTASNKSV